MNFNRPQLSFRKKEDADAVRSAYEKSGINSFAEFLRQMIFKGINESNKETVPELDDVKDSFCDIGIDLADIKVMLDKDTKYLTNEEYQNSELLTFQKLNGKFATINNKLDNLLNVLGPIYGMLDALIKRNKINPADINCELPYKYKVSDKSWPHLL